MNSAAQHLQTNSPLSFLALASHTALHTSPSTPSQSSSAQPPAGFRLDGGGVDTSLRQACKSRLYGLQA